MTSMDCKPWFVSSSLVPIAYIQRGYCFRISDSSRAVEGYSGVVSPSGQPFGSVCIITFMDSMVLMLIQRRGQNADKVTHIKGRPLDQAMILFNCIPFQIGTSLKGQNLLPEGANSFLYEQFLIVWKITYNTPSDLPELLLFLLRRCVT